MYLKKTTSAKMEPVETIYIYIYMYIGSVGIYWKSINGKLIR